MTLSRSKYRRRPYLQRLQVSSQRQRDNFYKAHPHRDAAKGKKLGPDSPFALWAAISLGIVRRLRNLKSRGLWRIRRARRRLLVRQAKVAEKRATRRATPCR